MLRLILMRHAQAASAQPPGGDFARDLSESGRQQAAAMGVAMADRGLLPARILCSSALRTRQTLSELLPHLAGETEICISRHLYQAEAADYLDAAREFGMAETFLMLIGHNPAIHEFALVLASLGDAAGLATLKRGYPAGALAVIAFDAPRWADIGPGAGRLISFLTPRSIADGTGA